MISSLKRVLPLLPGIHSSKKIIVIESDDWGAVRTSSKEAYRGLLNRGYPMDAHPFCKYDALESNTDMEMLLDVLQSVKNGKGEHPKLTCNYIVANPDFEKVKKGNFQKYYFENAFDTYRHYPSHDKVVDWYKIGIQKNMLRLQLHGREHLNVNRWLKGLQQKKAYLLDAFEYNMYSLRWTGSNLYPNEYMDALDCDSLADLESKLKIVSESTHLFKQMWGYDSESYIACCYIWHSKINQYLSELGIRFLQGLPIQRQPILKDGLSYQKKFHYLGQKSRQGLIYLVRNAFFEPSVYPHKDNVDWCLSRIALAFKYKKPSIISSHRLNFMGELCQSNRENNLASFKLLLKEIVKRWPEVEFMFSDELGNWIINR